MAALPFVGHAEAQRRFQAIQYNTGNGYVLKYRDMMSGAVYTAPSPTSTLQQVHNALLASGAIAMIGHSPSAF
jgi:hypothetical protein